MRLQIYLSRTLLGLDSVTALSSQPSSSRPPCLQLASSNSTYIQRRSGAAAAAAGDGLTQLNCLST